MSNVLGAVLCAAAGVVVLLFVIREWVRQARSRRGVVRTVGTVVSADPVIEFVDSHGRRYAFSPAAPLAVGRKIPVIYPAGRPRGAQVFNRRNRVILLVLGLLTVVASFGAAVFLWLQG